MKRRIKFGLIGCGLMGREFASAAARWFHINSEAPIPEIVAVCDTEAKNRDWFVENIPSVKYALPDYRDLLALEEIEAVYCAVPHVLHQEIYTAIIRAGKHLFGEKPFGMDRDQNTAILKELEARPEVFARCTSEFPYYPACQTLIRWVEEGRFGRIIEVRSGMKHSSDMDLRKPINWKRIARINGEYGCMGDLGIHTQHIPFRAGWKPLNVCAKLSKIVCERPDGKGGTAPCDTWDNAILLCDARDMDGNIFPLTFEAKRLSPGSTNDWYIEVYGMELSARFSTNDPMALNFTNSWGKEQAWSRIAIGYQPLFPSITGHIFEFGFPDAILQMWTAFMLELDGRKPSFGCFTPEETKLSHALQTAAIMSHNTKTVVPLVV